MAATLARTAPAAAPDDFDAVFTAHYPRLIRALTAAGGDAQLAADCVADAFERAFVRWRKISRYDDPVGWIRHVAVNRLRDHQRREGRKRVVLIRLGGDDATTELAPTAEIADLLAGLPQQQRLCVALHHLGGLSVAEVAEAIGVAPGTVKYHLHAGRASLRTALSEGDER